MASGDGCGFPGPHPRLQNFPPRFEGGRRNTLKRLDLRRHSCTRLERHSNEDEQFIEFT
jgi:hypothetical protein